MAKKPKPHLMHFDPASEHLARELFQHACSSGEPILRAAGGIKEALEDPLAAGIKISTRAGASEEPGCERIHNVILTEVMKRDVVEGDKFANAEKALMRAATKQALKP